MQTLAWGSSSDSGLRELKPLGEVRDRPGQCGLGSLVPIQFSQQPTSIGMKNLFLKLLLNPNLNRIHHY